MNAADLARKHLDECAELRADMAQWAKDHPGLARASRREAVKRGIVSPLDDPPASVRCSELEALCRAVLGITDPVPQDEAQGVLL